MAQLSEYASLIEKVSSTEKRGTINQFVYFLQADDRIKIGISTDVQGRAKGIESATGRKLSLLNTVKGGRTLEKIFHAHFADERIAGEWFSSSSRLLSFIQDCSDIMDEADRLCAEKKAKEQSKKALMEKEKMLRMAQESRVSKPTQSKQRKQKALKTVRDYPKTLSIHEASDMAVNLLPDLYPSLEKVKNMIRNKTYKLDVPGARGTELTGRQRKTWSYDRDKLIKWLADPALHKKGRRVGSVTKRRNPNPAKRKKGE